jgi:uncharacterized protein (TIGR02118 family)
MTITRLGTAPRAAGLSYTGFQDHWRGEHAGLAGGLPGLRRYLQNHAVLEDGLPVLPYAGFDACSEIEFDSVEAMDAAFASEHYRSTVTADEHALIERSRFMLALMERSVVRDGAPPAGAVKLLSFWRTTARASTAELHDALAEQWVAATAGAGHVRHEQLHTLDGVHEGRPGPVCDAVDILTFADLAAAHSFTRSAQATDAEWQLAGIGSCAGRLIASEVAVA